MLLILQLDKSILSPKNRSRILMSTVSSTLIGRVPCVVNWYCENSATRKISIRSSRFLLNLNVLKKFKLKKNNLWIFIPRRICLVLDWKLTKPLHDDVVGSNSSGSDLITYPLSGSEICINPKNY